MKLDLRRGAAATTLLLALGGVAACGNNSSAGSAASSPSSAPATLTRADFASTMSSAIARYHSAHITLALGSTVHAVGDVAYQGTAPLMKLAMTFAGHQADLRFVGGTAYLSMTGLTPAGTFLAIKPSNAMMGSLVKQLKSFGPDGAISMLRGAVKGFKDVGTSTIDGQQVRHYRVTVDPSAMVKKMGLPAGAAPGSLPKSVTEDLYVDSRNLMRRAVLDAAGQKVQIDATQWGEPVHVTAPPPSQVVKAPSGMGGMGSMGGMSGSSPAPAA